MQTPMMSCHLILTWHEWNANADDIMMWFALFVNLAMSHLACTSHAHMHGTCAQIKYGTPMYPSDLAWMQAKSNLLKLATSHFWVLNTQNAKKNMQNMLPIAYLKENLRYCNENLA